MKKEVLKNSSELSLAMRERKKEEGNSAAMSVTARSGRRQDVACMFKIVRFSTKLESFFQLLEGKFARNHYEFFRTLVLLVAFSWGRRNISALCRHLDPAASIGVASTIS